jgi:hypothetical protein
MLGAELGTWLELAGEVGVADGLGVAAVGELGWGLLGELDWGVDETAADVELLPPTVIVRPEPWWPITLEPIAMAATAATAPNAVADRVIMTVDRPSRRSWTAARTCRASGRFSACSAKTSDMSLSVIIVSPGSR